MKTSLSAADHSPAALSATISAQPMQNIAIIGSLKPIARQMARVTASAGPLVTAALVRSRCAPP